MKLYAPKYYKDFKCIADKCTHSCCIGWEIDIDEDTLFKYRSLKDGYGKPINESISCEDTPHFNLLPDERCPHLDEKGLCKIIINAGEEYLCHICREHPRFYNYIGDRAEAGVGMSCEEACRIILTSDEYGTFFTLEDGAEEYIPETVALREEIYSLLSDISLPYTERLNRIYAQHGVSPSCISDFAWRKTLSSLEYMDISRKELFCFYSSELFDATEYEKYLQRALAYFIYRHCTEACTADEYRISLGFCLFCERLLASVLRAVNTKNIPDIFALARIISEEIEYSEDNTESIKNVYSLILQTK